VILSFFYGIKSRKRAFLSEKSRRIKLPEPENKSIGQQFIENGAIKAVFFNSTLRGFSFVSTNQLLRRDETFASSGRID
jgi:hypothetical protein